jgi:two-component system chemotaxis response regulator CheB
MIKKSIKDTADSIFDLVVIGSSAGGIEALIAILSALNTDFRIPLVIVQHRSELSPGLTDVLQTSSPLPVIEPEDKTSIQPGFVYVAPSGYHLLIEKDSFVLSVDERVNWSRPSIDVLFETAAESFGPKVIGVVLTGRNNDGAAGLACLKQFGALTVVQEPSSAPSPHMPEYAIATSIVDHILDLTEISHLLNEADRTKKQFEDFGHSSITKGGMVN